MAIAAQCPICRRKQSLRNKLCKECGENLDKAKKSGRIIYYVYHTINKKKKWEMIGKSIENARAADGKRKGQKKENRILEIVEDSKITFQELTEWYLDLKKVKKLKSFKRVKQALASFNNIFGTKQILKTKQIDLEGYQEKRIEQGRSSATIDMEIKYVQTMINKAFDNDEIDGRALKPFRKTKRLLKAGDNARKRLITFDEYTKLIENAAPHLKSMLTVMFNTGMRTGEIRQLKWSMIDRKVMMIRVPSEITKEKKEKNVPINHHVKIILDNTLRYVNHRYIFTYNGQPILQRGGIKRSFKTACKNAKIPYGQKTSNGITPHDFRRTVKTNMLSAGVDKAHRDMILGHSLQGMDVNYLIGTDEALTTAMDKYTKWLDKSFKQSNQKVTKKTG